MCLHCVGHRRGDRERDAEEPSSIGVIPSLDQQAPSARVGRPSAVRTSNKIRSNSFSFYHFLLPLTVFIFEVLTLIRPRGDFLPSGGRRAGDSRSSARGQIKSERRSSA